MKKINFILALVATLILGLNSCTKEGPAGPAGKDGNANVKTQIIKVFGYEWKQDGSLYIVDKETNLLTKDIVNSGSAHLYVEVGEDMWVALPYIKMGYGVSVNDLGIWTESSSVTNKTTTFKLVVIQGNIVNLNKKVDFNNYNDVKKYFNLND